jgi:hypothetical protein
VATDDKSAMRRTAGIGTIVGREASLRREASLWGFGIRAQ